MDPATGSNGRGPLARTRRRSPAGRGEFHDGTESAGGERAGHRPDPRVPSGRTHEPPGDESMASANFQTPVSRRGFLTVGTIGLGGLTLADLLRLEARADQKNYAAMEVKADSVIHIFLPDGS